MKSFVALSVESDAMKPEKRRGVPRGGIDQECRVPVQIVLACKLARMCELDTDLGGRPHAFSGFERDYGKFRRTRRARHFKKICLTPCDRHQIGCIRSAFLEQARHRFFSVVTQCHETVSCVTTPHPF